MRGENTHSFCNQSGLMNSNTNFQWKTPPSDPRGGSSNVHPPDRVKKTKPGSSVPDELSVKGQVFQGLAIIGVAWLVATAGFKSMDWIQQQLKPFCDSASFSRSDNLSLDDCIPCPQNGRCVDGRLECFVGFRRVGKTCVEDKEIHQTAEKLAGYLKDHVCGLAALALCDGASGAVWVTDAEVQARLQEAVLPEQRGLDGVAWTLVWEKTVKIARNSMVTQLNTNGMEEFHCPAILAQRYKSFECIIREWILANLLTIFVMSPMVAVVALYGTRYVNRKKIYARAEEVYLQVCEALEEKALEARGTTGGESWVVVSRLRDHVLKRSERKWTALWVQVENLVQDDSRIDQYQKKVKGEMKIVWEWQVEGALRTPGSRKKVRPQPNILHEPVQLQSPEQLRPQQI